MSGLTSAVTDAAYDSVNNTVYVAYGTAIDRTPDGAFVSSFSTGGGAVTGLDVDPVGGFVYWAEASAIKRATLAGGITRSLAV